MKRERQIEELAKLDGMKFDRIMFIHAVTDTTAGPEYDKIPNYLNSHDALQPILDGMDEKVIKLYDACLVSIVVDLFEIHRAAPEQKAEAILKALGKWEEK